ncbi:hypothetical protein B1207_13205 [Legionella quinlivanii]|uniref:Uncharacterized protein n=1 Tax=Legionella quinlivanii TaxID=45073 RepID=A0A364LGJ9_9GAMM|nr:ankyrin repeat domain-containing protein [Legionella quinlivanii]RAP35324.1 hypothetical protein B1207_13205 [Legionella quinlivanii]
MIDFNVLDSVLKDGELSKFLSYLKSINADEEQRDNLELSEDGEISKEELGFLAQQKYEITGVGNFTLLNYLILKHDANELNLIPHISYILPHDNFISGKPVHFALRQKKLDLIPPLLGHFIPLKEKAEEQIWGSKDARFRVLVEEHDDEAPVGLMRLIDSTDENGFTLLARAVQTRDAESLRAVLLRKPRLDEPTAFRVAQKSKVLNSALHQAVRDDWAEGVRMLIESGANPEIYYNPATRITPFVIAIRYAKIDALKVLLKGQSNADRDKSSADKEKLLADKVNAPICDPTGNTQDRPINVLCQHLSNEKDKNKIKSLLAGIAMLICRGSTVPESKNHRNLLTQYREQLASEIASYAENSYKRSRFIILQLHAKNTWHKIFYPESGFFSHLAGNPGKVTKKMENLVLEATLKYRKKEAEGKIPDKKKERHYSSDEIKLAVFTRLFYKNRNEACCGGNPWAAGFWNLGEGRFNSWDEVRLYATSDKGAGTRTSTIYNLIESNKSSVHNKSALALDNKLEALLDEIAQQEEEKAQERFMV